MGRYRAYAVDYKYYNNGEIKEIIYFEEKQCYSDFHLKYKEYDKKGNWIKAINLNELTNEKDTIKRTIEYYK